MLAGWERALEDTRNFFAEKVHNRNARHAALRRGKANGGGLGKVITEFAEIKILQTYVRTFTK